MGRSHDYKPLFRNYFESPSLWLSSAAEKGLRHEKKLESLAKNTHCSVELENLRTAE